MFGEVNDLQSTMVRLRPLIPSDGLQLQGEFTIHYGEIKTGVGLVVGDHADDDLQSTMVRLRRHPRQNPQHGKGIYNPLW